MPYKNINIVPPQQSIKTRLTRNITLVAMMTLLTGGLLVTFDEIRQYQNDFIERMQLVNRTVGNYIATDIAFDDIKAVNENLELLRHLTSVQNVIIYDVNGEYFESLNDEPDRSSLTADTDTVVVTQSTGRVQIVNPILYKGKKYGYIKLIATTTELNAKIRIQIALLVMLAGVLGLLAFILSRLLQNQITEPILDLVRTTSGITASKDYDVRLENKSNDEIGLLYQSFNSMLDEIAREKRTTASVLDETRRSQALFSAIFNAIPDAVILTDADRKIQIANPACLKLFQYEPSELIGKDTEIMYPDRHSYMTVAAVREKMKTHPISDLFEVQYKRKDGSVFWSETMGATVILDDGRTVGIIALIRDISKRKADELKLLAQREEQRQILDTMLDAMVTINQGGSITTFNRSAENMFGYRADEVIGRNISMLMPHKYAAMHDQYLGKYYETGVSGIMGTIREFSAVRKSGEEFPIRLTVTEMPPDEEGGRNFLGTIRDITQIKQQETMLVRAQKMDALGKLTGGIAHDFNNILNVILGYTQLLQPMLENKAEEKGYIDEIYNAGKLASQLTAKLTTFSRVRPMTARQIDLNRTLLDTRLMLEKTLTPSINITFDLADDLWSIYIDDAGLVDSILNLSINAMHAMTKGGVLTFRTRNITLDSTEGLSHVLDEGEYVELTVTDTGAGMSEEVQQNIFEPFYTTKGEEGTGLGLSQVYQFVQQSSGEIELHSKIGEGTSFTLYFPRSYMKSDAKERLHADQPGVATSNKTVLVVDDEPALNNLAKTILEKGGYRVLTALNGEEALSVLERHHVDILLSDVIMPGMSGYQLAEQVKQRYPDIRIQLVSGYDHVNDMVERDGELRSRILDKPYTTTELLQRINKLSAE